MVAGFKLDAYFKGNVGTTRHHVKKGGHNTGAKGARASTSEVELDRVGVGMLLAGYARDCQQRAVVLTWRCINPHPGILPNCPTAHHHPAPPNPQRWCAIEVKEVRMYS